MHAEDERRKTRFRSVFREAGFDEAEANHRADAYFALGISEYLRNGGLQLAERIKLARTRHTLLVERR